MVCKSEDLLAAISDDLREIWRTGHQEYDRVINIREKDLSQEGRQTRRDSLRRSELIMSVAHTDPEDVAILTLVCP
jgi:hypothetical protein